MAWPFSGIGAPNVDSGWVTLPSSATNVPNSPSSSVAGWLLGATFANKTEVSQKVTVTDGGGKEIVDYILTPHETKPFAWEFVPITGVLQWFAANASAVDGKIWGYT